MLFMTWKSLLPKVAEGKTKPEVLDLAKRAVRDNEIDLADCMVKIAKEMGGPIGITDEMHNT